MVSHSVVNPKDSSVGPQVGPAATGIGDDRVIARWREQIDHPAGEGRGEGRFAIVAVQRSAARLDRRGVDLAAIGEENVGGVAVDVAENQILNATGEQSDAMAGGMGWLLVRFDELVGEPGGNGRGEWFELAERRGQQTGGPAAARQILQA